MVRKEKRRIKRMKALRDEREKRIEHQLELRANYRKKTGLKQRSMSVDRYHEYTDKEHERNLIKEQIALRTQIAVQQANNRNIQNVLMGLAAVRMLLDTAQASGTDVEQTGPQHSAMVQIQAALQAEQFLQVA